MPPTITDPFSQPAIERHASLVSTNDEAMRRARDGHAGNLWIVADQQTGGRGRNGRVWDSPPGNLHASLLLINPAPTARMPELGFVSGVAVATALRQVLGGDEKLKIKWPNDMLYQGAKLAGLMLEGATLPDGRFACIIGVGVNCITAPDNLAYPATSLTKITGRETCALELFTQLTLQMRHWLAIYGKMCDFSSIRTAWLDMAIGLGQPVEIAMGERRACGLFSGIDLSGRLLLARPDGVETICAGDVFLTSPPPLHL